MSISLLTKKTPSSGSLFAMLLKLINESFKIKFLKFFLNFEESGSHFDEEDSILSASWVAGV